MKLLLMWRRVTLRWIGNPVLKLPPLVIFGGEEDGEKEFDK